MDHTSNHLTIVIGCKDFKQNNSEGLLFSQLTKCRTLEKVLYMLKTSNQEPQKELR